MKRKTMERWSPLVLLVIIVAIWELITRGFGVSEFIFPSPSRIWNQTLEFKEVIMGHAWRTFWVTMVGFGIAIVVGVLLGFLIGSSRMAYAAVYPLLVGLATYVTMVFANYWREERQKDAPREPRGERVAGGTRHGITDSMSS